MNKEILVTGANGQLGNELAKLASIYESYNFTFTGHSTLDLSNKKEIVKYFEKNHFDIIINAAAYTAVDKAEEDVQAATLINTDGVKALAEIAKENKTHLIHVSTDYVFNGENYRPYIESDPTSPLGVYGRSKLDGEKAMLEVNPANSIIIRTSWLYSSYGANFVKTMLRLGKERDELGIIFDQIGTPTYANDLASAILEILPMIDNDGTEIYHYSNEGACSWYDFAIEIFDLSDILCNVKPIESKEYVTPTKRPHFSVLNKTKIKTAFGISIPHWKDSLKACLKQIESEKQ